jgi:hypothetical protein
MVDGGPLLGAALEEIIIRRENSVRRRHGDRAFLSINEAAERNMIGRRLRQGGPGLRAIAR